MSQNFIFRGKRKLDDLVLSCHLQALSNHCALIPTAFHGLLNLTEKGKNPYVL